MDSLCKPYLKCAAGKKEITMKILHTGDWHIGKLVHGVHMTEDQRFALMQLIQLIEIKRPDVLIIAGDVYDRSVPPIEAVELLDEVLTEIVLKHQVKVFVIAGNHDSPDRVGFASKILRDHGLFISGNITRIIEPIVLEDEDGPVNFYLIPYAEPAIIREIYDDPGIKSHDAAMKAVLSPIIETLDPKTRNICVAHAFLMGTETLEVSESVRPLSIGGSEYVDAAYFEAFNYVALGHLHRPQKVLKETIRYAGSLLKYSFSEAMQKKSVAMIDLDGQGKTSVELISLEPVRDMRIIKGHLENLVDVGVYGETNIDDYVMAVLTDEGELIDPINTLRAVYPNVLRVEKESYDRVTGDNQTSASDDFKQKTPLELFHQFYENITGEIFDEEKNDIITELVTALEQRERLS